jgi:hypothetical protein
LTDSEGRHHRAGETIEDLCRACHTTRLHTIIAMEPDGRVARVMCDFCRSEHNYRGGGEERPRASASPSAGPISRPAAGAPAPARLAAALPLVGERERMGPRMSSTESGDDLELLLRRILREELGLTAVVPADKWRGGELILRPGKPGLQEKKWPLESFFHKVVMIRNKLRTLEQQVNASELPDDAKVRLQSYISGCYGTLTSFNVLFADEDDHFKGAGGD